MILDRPDSSDRKNREAEALKKIDYWYS